MPTLVFIILWVVLHLSILIMPTAHWSLLFTWKRITSGLTHAIVLKTLAIHIRIKPQDLVRITTSMAKSSVHGLVVWSIVLILVWTIGTIKMALIPVQAYSLILLLQIQVQEVVIQPCGTGQLNTCWHMIRHLVIIPLMLLLCILQKRITMSQLIWVLLSFLMTDFFGIILVTQSQHLLIQVTRTIMRADLYLWWLVLCIATRTDTWLVQLYVRINLHV